MKTDIITSPQGLKLTNSLAEELYTSPLDGMFTNDVITKALTFGDKLPLSGITKSLAYRYMFLILKGSFLLSKYFRIKKDKFLRSLQSFKGLPHRQEIFLKRKSNIFINDSKATTFESTKSALHNYDNIIWILGGLPKLNDKIGNELVNVFVPTTPNPTSGFLLMVPKKNLIFLDISFEQASKFIVSAGTSDID